MWQYLAGIGTSIVIACIYAYEWGYRDARAAAHRYYRAANARRVDPLPGARRDHADAPVLHLVRVGKASQS